MSKMTPRRPAGLDYAEGSRSNTIKRVKVKEIQKVKMHQSERSNKQTYKQKDLGFIVNQELNTAKINFTPKRSFLNRWYKVYVKKVYA